MREVRQGFPDGSVCHHEYIAMHKSDFPLNVPDLSVCDDRASGKSFRAPLLGNGDGRYVHIDISSNFQYVRVYK